MSSLKMSPMAKGYMSALDGPQDDNFVERAESVGGGRETGNRMFEKSWRETNMNANNAGVAERCYINGHVVI